MCLTIRHIMKLLDAINAILPMLGESPVTTVDARHPTVALITSAINIARQELLAEGWWFNEEVRILYVDPEGNIPTPNSILALYSLSSASLEPRGGFVYDLSTGSSLHPIGNSYQCRLVVDLPFEHLPHYAALYVQYIAGATVYTQDFGIEKVVATLNSSAQSAYNMLEQEELRKRKYSGTTNSVRAELESALRG